MPAPLNAAEIAVGDEIVLKRAAPLKLGRETLLKLDKGTKLTVQKVNGKYLQVAVPKEGEEVWGWIHSRYLEPETEITTSGPPAGNTSAAVQTFSAAEIQKLRQKAEKLALVPEATPDGWSKSLLDPMKVATLFKPLRVKKNYQLKAYQFKEEFNGNGVVWAMPVGATFPEPSELLEGENNLFRAPKPGKALDNVMEAIEGDRTAKSFLLASILKRELDEFGAMWHGARWSVNVVLDTDPWQGPAPTDEDDPLDHPSRPASKWKWKTAKPTDWRPTVTIKGNVATVKFYTYSALGKEGIYEHIDEYRPGEYRFTTERKKIAEGPRELAF
ncbi:SH3 domain-containing protein [Gimesia panareensis]|uniref:hypothetical protein n=1 Tax=Gimesia panareensis TaxID=2527978 RepID=UPI00119DAEF8|nr:hypothetical protein [Gimesia panareensis]